MNVGILHRRRPRRRLGRHLVLCGLLACLGATSPGSWSQTADDGQAAFQRGDFGLAERLWRPLAERGDAAAQTGLGNLHAAGRGVVQDFAAAAAWFTKAAEQGNAAAQTALAGLHLRGQGTPQDDRAALRWYRRAAEQGHAPAQANLGFLLETGRGGPKDESQAAQWYRRAAVQGEAAALANLASMADEGRGVPRDPVLAAALLSRAAGSAPARRDIAALNQEVDARLTPAQRSEADGLRASMGSATAIAAALTRLDGAVGAGPAAGTTAAAAGQVPLAAPAAPAPAAPTAPSMAAVPLAPGDVELRGRCLRFQGELASPGLCPDRAILTAAGAVRMIDSASGRLIAEFGFAPGGLRSEAAYPVASLNVVQVNGQPANGSCLYGALAQPASGAAAATVFAQLRCVGTARSTQQFREFAVWELSQLDPSAAERERWSSALNAFRDRVAPSLSDVNYAAARAAEAERRAQAGRPAAAEPPARPSDDPKAIFGLLVGTKLPSMRACRDDPALPKDQPWCFERENSGNPSLANLLTARAESYRQAGAVPFQVKVNDAMFDTSLLFAWPLLGNLPWIELWVTRSDMTIQMLSVSTRLPATDAMAALLTRKYGRPARRDDTEWRQNVSGQLMGRTPNWRWQGTDLWIDFESQSPGALFGEPGNHGTVTIHSADFARRVLEIERRNAPPPRRGM